MITSEQINATMDNLKELSDAADSPHEVYQLLMYATEVIGQRAYEVLMSHTKGTREYDWAIQVSKDARTATENAERMINWIESESTDV